MNSFQAIEAFKNKDVKLIFEDATYEQLFFGIYKFDGFTPQVNLRNWPPHNDMVKAVEQKDVCAVLFNANAIQAMDTKRILQQLIWDRHQERLQGKGIITESRLELLVEAVVDSLKGQKPYSAKTGEVIHTIEILERAFVRSE